MADIINLNKARKKKAKQDADKQAAENRVRFGRTKAQKQLDEARTTADREKLDQLKRENAEENPD